MEGPTTAIKPACAGETKPNAPPPYTTQKNNTQQITTNQLASTQKLKLTNTLQGLDKLQELILSLKLTTQDIMKLLPGIA